MEESDKQLLQVALIGTSERSHSMYGPLLKALSTELKLVSVWGRSTASARQLGENLGVPWYTNLDQLIRETNPQLGIVCVAYPANGEVGLMAVEQGLHVLLETPIAHKLSEADAIIKVAEQKGLKVEVAEQFHRRPMEQIKLKLISLGLFGRVYAAFNDFAGHGYHGVSVLRSYLGFNTQPIQVSGSVHQYELEPYISLDRHHPFRADGCVVETQQHGLIEFEGGKVGIFHWTGVSYASPLRWWRSSRFLAEKGMGITVGVGLDVQEWLSLLAPGNEAPYFITLERRWERLDGGALKSIVAHTGDQVLPIVRWDNPFFSIQRDHSVQWHDDEIGVASCILSLVNAIHNNTQPAYGPYQARLDQEITLALLQSAREGGHPISLPLDRDVQLD